MSEYHPMLGIFWYDGERGELFGIFKDDEKNIEPDSTGRRVFPVLHQDVWGELRNKYYDAYGTYVGDAKYPIEESNPMRELDYTLVPRGRVFSDDTGYQVFVGDWFFSMGEEEREDVKQLVLDEFGLWEGETVFVDDIHWHIGHGWGE